MNDILIARSRYWYTVQHVKEMEYQMDDIKNYGGTVADGSYTARDVFERHGTIDLSGQSFCHSDDASIYL